MSTNVASHLRFQERYPELGRENIPVSVNTSAEIFELEREVFRRSWLMVGRVEDVQEPGSYFVKEIPTLRTSILVTRSNDGEISAFHNTCQHRGNKLVCSNHHGGRAKGFSCSFHGWTYDLKGNLVIVPDEDKFAGLNKAERGLPKVNIGIWEGFIFVSIDPTRSLEEWLGERYSQFGGYFRDLHCFAHMSSDVKVNWKIFLDAFAEGYHVPFIHGKTLPDAITGEHNPLCHVLDIQLFNQHRMLSLPANPEYEPSPVEKLIARHIKAPVFPALKADIAKLPPGINPTKDPSWGFDINILFPTSYFAPWANGMLLIYYFWPISVEHTRWEVGLYWNKPKTAAELLNQDLTAKMTISVVREDLSSLETTQETLLSGSLDTMALSDEEIAVRHGYHVIAEAISNIQG
ncbi:aromatic ring-hydroxylating dioxygenase subunit alpha (plasmid) [Sphingobium sp. SJ10-10]|uniref:aromatic ring-hydroxylating oxygenase subunit alpha n=1 Tax=Sphingobium sp. SJ10-10 TaxID=3114999 RepID=UPI002E179BB8|nr:aromatic ring-hydroxylating dioxygenase subunit alpha [Sphingobium sp. SJ10-10]